MIKKYIFIVAIFVVTLFSNLAFVQVLESLPKYSYQEAIRESVFVKTDQGFKIAIDLIRPKETQEDLKVPVILIASPYYSIGRGKEHQIKKYDENGKIISFPFYYDNYFVPRGYAVVQVDVLGTNRSEGCPLVGTKEEIKTITTVIDWLCGRSKAWDIHDEEVTASWSICKVGMIGKSYDGTLAIGAASTGVEGLKTIVPICSIGSWYDWVSPNGHSDIKSLSVLHDYISNNLNNNCREILDEIQANHLSNYNTFWRERNYLENFENCKASVFFIAGLNDFNVRTIHLEKVWSSLMKHNIPRKLWLSQFGHVDPFDFRRDFWVKTIHKWFDYWLLNIENGIMNEPMADIQHGADFWETYSTWPDQDAKPTDFFLTPGQDILDGTLSFTPPNEGSLGSYSNSPEKTEYLKFISEPLDKDVRLSGISKVSLKAKTNIENINISVILLDYGLDERVDHDDFATGTEKDCYGDGTEIDTACYYKKTQKIVVQDSRLVSYGMFASKYRNSLEEINYLVPDKWYVFNFNIFPNDYVFKAGHKIGITISTSGFSDKTYTVDIDLSESKIAIPLVEYRQNKAFF